MTIATSTTPLPLTSGEKSLLFPPPRPMMDAWMAEHYRLPAEISDEPGPWQLNYVPFFIEPLQRLSAPPVKVGIEGCTQIGKTILMTGVFCYIVDCDPAPTLFLMPRETDVERRINTRIKPTFRDCPRLLGHVPGRDIRNINIGKETVFDRMIAYLAWSRSPASMADNSICNMLIDEPGKFELTSTGENPFLLAEKRQLGFRLRSRTLYVTSPQNKEDLSDDEFRSGSDARLWVPCHHCKLWHPIGSTEETLILQKTAEGEFYEPDSYLVGAAKSWYQCPHCKKRWTESKRAAAVAAGVWVHKTQTMTQEGVIVGTVPQTRHWTYRVNSLMIHPRFWTVEQEAADFARAMREKKAGSIVALRDYRNNRQAVPWHEVSRTIADESLQQRVLDNLHRRCVPTGARMLVAAADYHEDYDGQIRIDFEVRAFGVDLVNWVVLAGSVFAWEYLEQALMDPFPWADDDCDEEELMVSMVFVDAGDKPDPVYLWCGQFPGWAWPIKGVDSQRTPLVLSDLSRVHRDRAKRGKRRMASARIQGQQLVLVDQSFFSEQITSWVDPEATTTGATFFYAEILEDTAGRYFKELRGMHRVQIKKGGYRLWTWVPKTKSTPVHFHDVPRYIAAAAFFAKAHLMRSEAPVPPAMRNKKRRVRLSEKPRRRR